MRIQFKAMSLLAAVSILTGCVSNNVKEFRADPNLKHDVPHSSIGKIYLKSVTMPHDDTNSIMCRAAGNIYLPQMMTYSQYIQNALRQSIISMDKAAESQDKGHSMSIVLTQVTFDSLSGEWIINGNVTIDNHAHVAVNTKTDYGTSYDAVSACRNTSEAFDTAVSNFIKKVLNQPEIVKRLG